MTNDSSDELLSALRTALTDRGDDVVFEPSPPPVSLLRAVRRRRQMRSVARIVISTAVGALAAVAVSISIPEWQGALPATTGSKSTATLHSRTVPPSPLTARRGASAVWTGSKVLIWGGWRGNQLRETYYRDGAAFDPGTRTWQTLPQAPITARGEHVAVWTGREMVIWGGKGQNGSRPNDGAAYDPTLNSWRVIAAAPEEARSMAKGLMVDREVVIVGGSGANISPSARSILYYNPFANAWRRVVTKVPMYDATAVGSALVTLGLTAETGALRLQHVTRSGEVADLPEIDNVGTRPARFSIVTSGGLLGVLVTDSEWSGTVVATTPAARVASGPLASIEWRTATESPDALLPDFEVTSMIRGASAALPEGKVLLSSSQGTSIVDLADTSTEQSKDSQVCGAGAASTWTGSSLITWGGQLCRGDHGDYAQGQELELSVM